jgi:hypothetical protein
VCLKKCHFFQSKIKFLGHHISGNGISTDPDKIAAVQQCSRPRSIRELQSFLELCNYCSKFVKEYATLAAPLTDLLKNFNPPAGKKTPLLPWQEESHTAAFEALKAAICSAPCLRFFNPLAVLC